VIRGLVARNLRHHRSLLIAMMLGLTGFEVFLVWVGAQIEASAGLKTMFEMLPPAFRETLGSQFRLMSFSALVALGFQHPFTLAITIGFVVVAATIPAAERESGLLDLLLARPMPRRVYLSGSLAMVLAGVLLLPPCVLAGATFGLSLAAREAEVSWVRYVSCSLGLSALLAALGGVTLLVAAGSRRRGAAAARVVGLTLGLFVVETFADVSPALRWVRWASPFHYFKPIAWAASQEPYRADLLVLVGVFAGSTLLAFVRFERGDL